MASDPVALRGVVLGSREYKDRDRIISFLSSELGVIDVCVKGTGKIGSKFSAAAVPFIISDIVITSTGSFWYLKDFSIVSSNSGIMNSLEAMTVASHIGSVLASSYIDRTNARTCYELAVYSFYRLSEAPEKSLIIYSAFNWRFLGILGLAIEYSNCKKCSRTIDSAYLSINDGASYCTSCCEHSDMMFSSSVFLMTAGGVQALNYFLTCDIKELFAVRIDEASLQKLVLFTTRYLNVQLEGHFDSLLNLLRDLDL